MIEDNSSNTYETTPYNHNEYYHEVEDRDIFDSFTELIVMLIPLIYLFFVWFFHQKASIVIFLATFLLACPAIILQEYYKEDWDKISKTDKILNFSLGYLAFCKYLFCLIGLIVVPIALYSLNLSATGVIMILLVIIAFLIWRIFLKLH